MAPNHSVARRRRRPGLARGRIFVAFFVLTLATIKVVFAPLRMLSSIHSAQYTSSSLTPKLTEAPSTGLQWPVDPIPDMPDGSYKAIPRYIWQTSRSLPLSDRANATVSTWIALNPSWKHYVATDDDIDVFFRTKFPPNVHNAFSKLPLGVMKADTWRLAVTYYYGGVYGDIDTKCLRPIDEWVGPAQNERGCTAIVSMESYNSFANYALVAAPRHPVFKRALGRVVEKIERDGGVKPEDEHFVAAYTGPPVVTNAIIDVIHSKHEFASEIINDNEDKAKARAIGLCLEEASYFDGINVGHDFASITWGKKEHDSWRKERQNILDKHNIKPKKTGNEKGQPPRVHVIGGGKRKIVIST